MNIKNLLFAFGITNSIYFFIISSFMLKFTIENYEDKNKCYFILEYYIARCIVDFILGVSTLVLSFFLRFDKKICSNFKGHYYFVKIDLSLSLLIYLGLFCWMCVIKGEFKNDCFQNYNDKLIDYFNIFFYLDISQIVSLFILSCISFMYFTYFFNKKMVNYESMGDKMLRLQRDNLI